MPQTASKSHVYWVIGNALLHQILRKVHQEYYFADMSATLIALTGKWLQSHLIGRKKRKERKKERKKIYAVKRHNGNLATAQ